MANINKEIFKSYDIRGIFPKDLNEETAYEIGKVFAGYTKSKKVAVGRDMRVSSPVLSEALIKGISAQGVEVYNIGEVPTECLYFATLKYGCDAGVMVTASHNPKEYNGFKLIRKKEKRIQFISGKEMADIIKNESLPKIKKNGKIKELDIWKDFISHIFSSVEVNKIKPFKVVIDAGNGMAGKLILMIKDNLPIEIIPLNFKLDGNFPAHPSNPLEEGATKQINEEIKKEKADFGFIFDGDADRVFLIDEFGNFIKSDITLLLLSKYLLKKYPGKGIAYNLICSKAVPEFIKKWGGKPIRTQVGFLNVQKGILDNDGIMGGELAGHYSFKDNYYSDSGFMAFLILLQVISESGKKVSEIIKEFSLYAKGAEINFEAKNKEAILAKIKEQFFDGKQDYLDGVTVEYKDWWFNIRPSNTEPLLRLTIEADTKELLEEKRKELNDFIKRRQ